VAGLAAALKLVDARAGGADVEFLLLEARDRLGGTIETERSGGFTIEAGPDAFITDKPWALDLCRRLGLEDRLIGTQPGERRTYVVRKGRLAPVPEGFLLLAPTDLGRLAFSPLFSWPGKVRMALDLVLPRGPESDESIAAFIRRRLGREALERVAEPLVGGIYTGDVERLSLGATMPRFRDLERKHRSIILGLRAAGRRAPSAGARYDLFASHVEGMGGLIADLARRLPEGAVRLRAPVDGLRYDRGWRLDVGGESLAADALVLAPPAYAAAELLAPLDTELSRRLGAIEYVSSVTVTLAWRTSDFPVPLPGFGFVVPAVERRALLACTYASRKFAGRAPEGHELVRVFLGGALHPELVDLDDAVLVARVQDELRTLLGVVAAPILVRVHRHRRAMPQYTLGHENRVADIEARAAALPHLALAGAALRGVGIPDCVRAGEGAAASLL
jgi:oxygen-dependent protoporphyrinogen oxidase